MELNDLIPKKGRTEWVVKGKFLMFKKIEHIPIAYIEDDIPVIFLDVRISKEVVHIIKHLIKMNVDFYFTSPKMSNPEGINFEDYKEHIILHYLDSYSNKNFFYKIKDIEGFDFIQNMVSWRKKENCLDLIKSNYESVNKRVSKKYHDYYANRDYYEYDETIREEFRTLYRDIQISLLF